MRACAVPLWAAFSISAVEDLVKETLRKSWDPTVSCRVKMASQHDLLTELLVHISDSNPSLLILGHLRPPPCQCGLLQWSAGVQVTA